MGNESKRRDVSLARGRLGRREFVGGAAAFGLGASGILPGFSRPAAAQAPVQGGVLGWAVKGGDPKDSLDPATFRRQSVIFAGRCWGETLVEFDPLGRGPVPVLAESWSSTADAKTWTFSIRKGIQFHNGKELTAADAAATLERHLDKATKSGALTALGGVASIRAENQNLIIEQKSGNADLPLILADHHLIIQPGGGKEKPGAAIGTGPYKLVDWRPGEIYKLERVSDHWRQGVGHFDAVEIRVINDDTARIVALQDGQVQIINDVNPKLVALLERAPGVTIERTVGRGHSAFLMHCNKKPFDNPDLRLAMKLALNRQDMIAKILRGYGQMGNDFPINEAYPLFADDIDQREHDPERANFHFKKSGHEGPLVLHTSEAAYPGAVEASKLYRDHCAEAGITVNIKVDRAETYWSEVWNKESFSAVYWNGRPVQDQMYATAYLSTSDWNDTKWYRKEFDTLWLKARQELDRDARMALYREMALMVRDDGGLILPMFHDFIDARSSRLQGYRTDVNGPNANGFIGIRGWFG